MKHEIKDKVYVLTPAVVKVAKKDGTYVLSLTDAKTFLEVDQAFITTEKSLSTVHETIAKIQARIEELEQKLIPFLDKHSITEMKQYDRLDDLIEENENFLKLFREE